MNRSHKRPIVFAIRDFPTCCGTQSNVSRLNLPEKCIKNPRTSDNVSVKNPRIDHVVSSPKPQGASSLKQEPEIRNSGHGHVTAAPKLVRASSLRQEPEIRSSGHGHVTTAPNLVRTSSVRQEPEIRNSGHGHVTAAPQLVRTSSVRQEPETRNTDHREKVLEVLRLFKEVFKQLEREKRRGGEKDSYDGTSRIDIKTQGVIEKMGKQVNKEKRIGLVPGIKVGDVFQYKTELRVVGLHFKTMCGIDYMKKGDIKMATSIVSSEGNGYNDKFESDVVMIYTGEGGNVMGKEKRYEDQKMVKGNLALANSMREKSVVRVIRGEERWDKKGKRYVYDGLYLVHNYWLEKGISGKSVYKFKLCRIPGQPPLT